MLQTWLSRRQIGPAFLLSALVFGGLLSTASASRHEPFKGTFAEQFVTTSPCPTGFLCANASGTGSTTVTHKATESFYGLVNLALTDPTTQCAPDSATGSIVGQSPNALFISSAGTFCFTGATTGTDNGDFVIAGGTGRFAGASGGGTYSSTITFTSNSSGSSVEKYDGQIVVP